jgi:hypothetical protein
LARGLTRATIAIATTPGISFAIPFALSSVLTRTVPPRFPALLRAVALFVVLALLAALSSARTKGPVPSVDPDYVYALATANQFLHAWQTQDEETAILLLSDRLKQSTPDSALDSHLISSAKPQSFEIGRGKKLAPGRYQFPVALFQNPAKTKWTRPQAAALLVIKTGKNEWAIDKLP